MAREFFKNLPNTTTPVTAPRLNGLLDGDEPMGNVVVDSIRSKNMWQPILLGNQYNCSVSLSGNNYTISATGTDCFYGNVATTTGTSYSTAMGQLFDVKPNTTYTFTVSNNNLTKNYVSYFNSSKNSISYQRYDNKSFSFTTPNNCYYVSFRIGDGNSTSGSSYTTTIQLEEGNTATSFSPFQELNPNVSGLDNGHMQDADAYGGLAKRSVRANGTVFTVIDPNYQNSGFVRNAMVMCGDSGVMFIKWAGNNANPFQTPLISWSSLSGGKTCTITHSNGVLTFTFSATVYGGLNVLFMN